MRRLHFKRRGFSKGEVNDTVFEIHGDGPTSFIVLRGRADALMVSKYLAGRGLDGAPILRLGDVAEIEVWEEVP